MSDVHVLGAAATWLGPPGSSPADLTRLAAGQALRRAGVDRASVPGVFVGASGDTDAVAARLGLRRLGFHADTRIEHVSASACEAFQRAFQAVEMGVYDTVLCVGAGALPVEPWPDEALLAERAEAARRYMTASGATVDHLARISAKNLRQGALEDGGVAPSAEEVLESELLDWPLTRLMVAGAGRGAAALVLGASAQSAPRVRASLLVEHGGPARAARLAYEAAGLGPEDMDCAELQDVTAAAELAAYEELQLAPPGQGPELIDSGFTALGGVLPVNTSGGLLWHGELPSSSGLAQVCQLAWQLRGEAGARQVEGARVGLAQTGGNGLVAVTIISA